MKYDPRSRLNGLEILAHNYFDEIREKNLESKLIGISLVDLFNFSERNFFFILKS